MAIFQIFQTNYYYLNSLNALINPALAAPVLLSAAKMGLGTAVITPGLTTTIADLAEATFTGYAESATIVWGTPINDVDTTPTSISPSHLFRASGTAVTNTINNLFVTDGVASPSQGILGSARITPGVPIFNIGDGFAAVVDWNYGITPANSSVSIIS